MIRERFFFRETIATILADEPAHIGAAKEGILAARQALERYIAQDPFFQTTFEPYEPDSDEEILLRMALAAKKASVGPMAAVAGAIAWAGVDAMMEAGARFAVIDNGGDIAILNRDRPVRVGIHAGMAPLSGRLAFVIPPQDSLHAVCTSSATVGPSISFGVSDAVSVFSDNPALADAWATALCNELRAGDLSVLDRLDPTEVAGVFAVFGDQTVQWGNPPPVVRAHVSEGLISAGNRL